MNSFIPKRAKHESKKSQAVFVIVELCGLYDSLVSIMSLGFLTTELRARALFFWFPDN